jgi:hypothetical protein
MGALDGQISIASINQSMAHRSRPSQWPVLSPSPIHQLLPIDTMAQWLNSFYRSLSFLSLNEKVQCSSTKYHHNTFERLRVGQSSHRPGLFVGLG